MSTVVALLDSISMDWNKMGRFEEVSVPVFGGDWVIQIHVA